MTVLKAKDKEVLEYIKAFMIENGYTPTIRDICVGVGLSSTSSVQNHFDKLVACGYIERHDKRYSVKGMRYVNDGTGEIT